MDRLNILYILVIIFFAAVNAQEKTISINMDEQYQTIDNFGASDCWSFQKIGAWVGPQKERVADLLFSVDKGIGLSAWRFNIGGGTNKATIRHPWRTVETFEVAQGQYDWSRQEEERWFLQAAKERGVDQFIAFVNSPPARMTRNGYTNCTDGLGSTNLKNGYEDQFATYLVDILKHFRDEWGIVFDYISPVNEPQWEWNDGSNQEGNRAGNRDIKTIVNSLYDELQDQNVETEISLVESGDLQSWYEYKNSMNSEYGVSYGNYLKDIYSDNNIQSKIGKHLSGHSYWSDRIASELVQDRQALYLNFIPFFNNGWKYWMTEYTVMVGPEGEGGRGRDLTMKTALDVARVIHYDLTILQASAWQWWTAVSPEDYKDGLIYTDYLNNPSSQSIIESKLLWVLGNYSRYVRPGAVRVKLTGADDKFGLLGSAYMEPDSHKLIVVLVNTGTADQTVSFDIIKNVGNDIISFTPFVTSDAIGDDLKQYPEFSADVPYTVPARSVVTLVGSPEKPDTSYNYSPDEYRLFQNYPNPFNKSTVFDYYLPEPGNIKISVYSAIGQKVKTIVNDFYNAGIHRMRWDGTNANNEIVSSGVYLYSLQTNSINKVKKMLFLN